MTVLCSVVVPAHDEEAVIGRLLQNLHGLVTSGLVELVVSCNGCRDATASIARSYAGVRVLESPVPSKSAALNAADDVASAWPRLYVDADIEIDPRSVVAVAEALAADHALAGRPPFRYDTSGATAPVRAYYRARGRLPGTRSALWGAGVYALSRQGHDRLGEFPAVTGDDLYVDALFADHEKVVVDAPEVVVRTPRSLASLVAVLTRQATANDEHARSGGQRTSASTSRALVTTIRSPASALDAASYAAVTLYGRTRARRQGPGASWERDESSRTARHSTDAGGH